MTLPQFPCPRAFADTPDRCFARVCLGLTVYTRHRSPADAESIAALFHEWVRQVPDETLLLRTSLTPAWVALPRARIEEIGAELHDRSLTGNVRHLWSFHVADSAGAPESFFNYREAAESRGAAGFVQLGWPVETPPARLMQIALWCAERIPLWCGVGGYLGSPDPVELAASHDVYCTWARRYWGLDVQDPDRARLRAHHGLPSINWLTLIGRDLLDQVELDGLRGRAERCPSLELRRSSHADLLRAGIEPSLCDAHAMMSYEALGEVSAVLAPLLLPEPVRLYGGFWENDTTQRWVRRFLEPEAWS